MGISHKNHRSKNRPNFFGIFTIKKDIKTLRRVIIITDLVFKNIKQYTLNTNFLFLMDFFKVKSVYKIYESVF